MAQRLRLGREDYPPPHALLILGIRSIDFGMLFLILAAMNRASAAGNETYKSLRRLFLYLGGLVLGGQMFFIMEYTWDVALHRVIAYICLAIAVPMVFATISQASRFRWAATTISAIYAVSVIAFILIFPLFPAQPKLGPVFYPVTHLVPPKFPILLIVPALALDLLWHRIKAWKLWQIALVSGVVFVAVMFAVEWPFANFLLSHASENRFFGTIYFDYNSRPDGFERLRQFFRPDRATHYGSDFSGLRCTPQSLPGWACCLADGCAECSDDPVALQKLAPGRSDSDFLLSRSCPRTRRQQGHLSDGFSRPVQTVCHRANTACHSRSGSA